MNEEIAEGKSEELELGVHIHPSRIEYRLDLRLKSRMKFELSVAELIENSLPLQKHALAREESSGLTLRKPRKRYHRQEAHPLHLK